MQIIVVACRRPQLWKLRRTIHKAAPDARVAGFRKKWNALSYASGHLVDVAFVDTSPYSNEQMFIEHLQVKVFAEQLQAIQPKINIIFVSAEAESYFMLKAFNLFASGYLIKPLGVHDIAAELQNLLYPAMGR